MVKEEGGWGAVVRVVVAKGEGAKAVVERGEGARGRHSPAGETRVSKTSSCQ